MKYFIKTIIICVFLAGCTKETQRIEQHKNGRPRKIEKYKNGIIIGSKSYYESGQISTEVPYVNGVVQGLIKNFYENGNLCATREFKNNKKDGTEIFYYPTGEVLSIAEYKAIRPYEYGILYGNFDVFNKDSEIIASGTCKLGFPWNGTFTSASQKKLLYGREEKYLLEYDKGKLIKVSELEKPIIKLWEPSKEEIDKIQSELNLKKEAGN